MIIRWTGHVVIIASLLPLIASRPSLTPEMRDSICTTQCDAQFKSDFRLSFSRDYDLDFFDIPLDPLLVSSLQNLTAFCYLVEQKQECYKA
ncbi:hypothetical protein PRIPAC_76544 [Pristionchus pacificus]|nr:hypothetical protein PRIPAC_76544 [Pristionchus pacificus]